MTDNGSTINCQKLAETRKRRKLFSILCFIRYTKHN